MKNFFLGLFLASGVSVLAQTMPYQPFEVDSAAEPRGGVVFFNTFIQATLRKSIPAQAAGVGGRVIVEGVVEPNGHISNVKVLQKMRPDCDREAARVFRLFNAWKPGLKNGQPVRQRVTMPIAFQPNTPFVYVNGNRITYFETDSKVTADSSQAQYKQISPIDTSGVPAGDIVIYELKSKSWKEVVRLPLVRKNNAYPNSMEKPVHLIGYPTSIIQWEGQLMSVDDMGVVISQADFQKGKPIGTQLLYHPNGAIAEKKDKLDEKLAIMTWYMNGQIREIKSANDPYGSGKITPDQITALWDSTGHQEVIDGNGQAIYEAKTRSRSDTSKQTQFIEQGLYKDGFKQGTWTGRYADGSYFYEEQYDKGICQSGKARSDGRDTARYQVVELQPEFMGGMQALGQFLSQNLRYPVDAQHARAQGKVFVTFMINADGSVEDVQVLSGIGYGADEEAARVVKAMSGKWKPGLQRGEKVRVKYKLPINFTLN